MIIDEEGFGGLSRGQRVMFLDRLYDSADPTLNRLGRFPANRRAVPDEHIQLVQDELERFRSFLASFGKPNPPSYDLRDWLDP